MKTKQSKHSSNVSNKSGHYSKNVSSYKNISRPKKKKKLIYYNIERLKNVK